MILTYIDDHLTCLLVSPWGSYLSEISQQILDVLPINSIHAFMFLWGLTVITFLQLFIQGQISITFVYSCKTVSFSLICTLYLMLISNCSRAKTLKRTALSVKTHLSFDTNRNLKICASVPVGVTFGRHWQLNLADMKMFHHNSIITCVFCEVIQYVSPQFTISFNFLQLWAAATLIFIYSKSDHTVWT